MKILGAVKLNAWGIIYVAFPGLFPLDCKFNFVNAKVLAVLNLPMVKLKMSIDSTSFMHTTVLMCIILRSVRGRWQRAQSLKSANSYAEAI